LDEVLYAYAVGQVDLHALVKVEFEGERMQTTVGRVLFHEIFPEEMRFFNETADKKNLEQLVSDTHARLGGVRTAEFLDQLKNIGFEYATLAGVTVGIDDLKIPPEKAKMVEEARKEVGDIQQAYENGLITNGERYNKVIDTWTRTTSEVAEVMFRGMATDRGGFNPVFMMADSGARSSKEQIRQLAGMRGLMAKPQKRITGQIGEIIESPIIANFREGLTVQEYFISTHGARKGLADTALKTADAGYLTRRLVDVAQDVIITENDCGTILGINATALKDGEEVIESLSDRIVGRVVLEDVYDPIEDDRLLVEMGAEVTEEAARQIEEAGVESVYIRSVLTCESRRGVCAHCYGRNLAANEMVQLGEAVGVVAAQSIGEPGTQLTLRTFHIGGTAARITEQSQVTAKVDGSVRFDDLRLIKRKDGQHVAVSRDADVRLYDVQGRPRSTYKVPYAATVAVVDGQEVKKGDVIFEWIPYTNYILAEVTGTVQYEDIVEGVSMREELDEVTGLMQLVIVEQREKTLLPRINVLDKSGRKRGTYSIPTGAYLEVHDGEEIHGGRAIAKIPRDISKTRDITGGLPRVAELFEVRKPRDPAVVSEVDGVVEYGKIIRGNTQIFVHGDEGENKEYIVPHGKHMRVHEGDRVKAGDRLCEGSIDPHDMLGILGAGAVQEYLVNEVQEVYRLQGVKINDKHFEVIVRQMLQKVQVEEVGDTNFLEGEKVDKHRFREENERIMAEGGEPATSRDLLLGITRASLSTDSFISAASFQETTKVLTEASVSGKEDKLRGLKENVIIGHLIPAGTGLEMYRNIELENDDANAEDQEDAAEEASLLQENA
ncbi:MAG: DNA-directed RNA polymerase subunit beta', partial [bacterium]